MPHNFTATIEAAFAKDETARAGKIVLPPPRFEFGPYSVPHVAIGQTVECACYGEVRVVGWSEGPLPWPQCHIKGPRSLVLFEDLARAVEVESARTVAIAWGVSGFSVAKWRRALNVERANAGTTARWTANMALVINPERNIAGLARAHSIQARLRAEATKAKTHKIRQQWTPEQLAQMGVLSDAEVAKLAGCNARTVERERHRRGIASIGHGGTLPDLQPLNGAHARAQRHALELTQAEVGARFGCNAHRISHLESGHAPLVTQSTLDKLARALECTPSDISNAG